MIDAIELRTEALKDLLGNDDDGRLSTLIKAEPRCLEDDVLDPCRYCMIQGQIARTHNLSITGTAQKIIEICCPEEKRPVDLKNRMTVMTR